MAEITLPTPCLISRVAAICLQQTITAHDLDLPLLKTDDTVQSNFPGVIL